MIHAGTTLIICVTCNPRTYLNLSLICLKELLRYWPSRISESNLGFHQVPEAALSKAMGIVRPQQLVVGFLCARYAWMWGAMLI